MIVFYIHCYSFTTIHKIKDNTILILYIHCHNYIQPYTIQKVKLNHNKYTQSKLTNRNRKVVTYSQAMVVTIFSWRQENPIPKKWHTKNWQKWAERWQENKKVKTKKGKKEKKERWRHSFVYCWPHFVLFLKSLSDYSVSC